MNGSIRGCRIVTSGRVVHGLRAVAIGARVASFSAVVLASSLARPLTNDEPKPVAAPAGERIDSKTWEAASAAIDEAKIQTLVDTLASDDMNGRYFRSEDGWRAARYIAGQFEAAGWKGAGDDEGGFFQHVEEPKRSGGDWKRKRPGRPPSNPNLEKKQPVVKPSPNVVAMRRGSGDAHILLTAHYDHLEPATSGDDRIFNGADDNAAGVAALIALARAVTAAEISLDTTILLIAFTGEEYGLVGSSYYVEHPRLPLESALCIINADMISRGEPKLLYVEGGRQFPALARAAKRANERPGVELDLHFDEHPRWLYMSDQRPFVFRSVPALYLGVDFHPDTHRVTDEASRILPGLVVRTTRLLLATAIELDGLDPSATRPPR